MNRVANKEVYINVYTKKGVYGAPLKKRKDMMIEQPETWWLCILIVERTAEEGKLKVDQNTYSKTNSERYKYEQLRKLNNLVEQLIKKCG